MTDVGVSAPAAAPAATTDSTNQSQFAADMAEGTDVENLSESPATEGTAEQVNVPADGVEQETVDDGTQGEPITLTINGKDQSFTLEQVKAAARKELAGEGIFEKIKQEKEIFRQEQAKQTTTLNVMKQFATLLKNGDVRGMERAMKHYKIDTKPFYDGLGKFMLEEYEYEKMSPEAKEAHRAKSELALMKQQQQEEVQRRQQQEHQAQFQQISQHLEVETPKVIKAVGVPDTKIFRQQMLAVMTNEVQAGRPVPNLLAVAQYVKQQFIDAKLLPNGQPQAAPVPRQRPKATAQSVGMKQPESFEYESFEQMRRNRR